MLREKLRLRPTTNATRPFQPAGTPIPSPFLLRVAGGTPVTLFAEGASGQSGQSNCAPWVVLPPLESEAEKVGKDGSNDAIRDGTEKVWARQRRSLEVFGCLIQRPPWLL